MILGLNTTIGLPTEARDKNAPRKVPPSGERSTSSGLQGKSVDVGKKADLGQLTVSANHEVSEEASLEHKGNSVRIQVRDPKSVDINNVIIEILDSKGDVVATIPPRELLHLIESSNEFSNDQAKGLLLDQRVG